MATSDHRSLMFIPSRKIKEAMVLDPVDWKDMWMGLPNGPGNLLTPTFAVVEFMKLLQQEGGLFNHRQYIDYCKNLPTWRDWWLGLRPDQQRGMEVRLWNNFFVSMIDNLHIWAMLSEQGVFKACYMDSEDDAVRHRDLTLRTKNDEMIYLALYGPKGKGNFEYKIEHRGASRRDAYVVPMTTRPRHEGNKMWYTLDDFAMILADDKVALQSDRDGLQYSFLPAD